jgi:SAM-dependent methyltransferase
MNNQTMRKVLRPLSAAARQARLAKFRLLHLARHSYKCPVCAYRGPFRDVPASTGMRRDAECPSCHALERHRLQFLVLARILAGVDSREKRMLHVAPEALFRGFFAQRFRRYETADLHMGGVDHQVDLQQMPFADASFDFVFASHVLEHVADDAKAISEIRRILTPNGIAVLPVPIIAEKTVEYGAPNPHEHEHVRAPGFDYFDRYRKSFAKVDTYPSDAWPDRHQLFVFEDRSNWPTAECPLRPPMQGKKHVDIVPVCYA